MDMRTELKPKRGTITILLTPEEWKMFVNDVPENEREDFAASIMHVHVSTLRKRLQRKNCNLRFTYFNNAFLRRFFPTVLA